MQVVRFVLESQRTFEVPGAGYFFLDGVLDIPITEPTAVVRARYLVKTYGATELGVIDAGTPPPPLPARPLPTEDPFPQYVTEPELNAVLADVGAGGGTGGGSSGGPNFIGLDTDGTPYFDPTGSVVGRVAFALDADGVPYLP